MRLVLTFLLLGALALVEAMEPLSDRALGDVRGQDGVLLSLDLTNNFNTQTGEHRCGELGELNDCRWGLEFADREGVWLMLKDYYGHLTISDFRIDAEFLPSTATSFADYSRFSNEEGRCLLTGQMGACAASDLAGLPALIMGYSDPDPNDDQRPVNVSLFFNIGRLGLEYDSSTPVGANLPVACGGAADCVPGYMRDTGVSVLGMRLSNSQGPNAAAQARFDGRAYVFGF